MIHSRFLLLECTLSNSSPLHLLSATFHLPLLSYTSCNLRIIGSFLLFRLLRTVFLHLLHTHVMVVMLDCLLTVACELWLPLALALLLFRQRILLVGLVVLGDFWMIFLVCYKLAISSEQLYRESLRVKRGMGEVICFGEGQLTSITLVQCSSKW